ncbi:MAG: hypothetical protein JWL57_3313 [Actinobacteria bacterium]|nr:hypothetical protein [Actinomycetota bacterium]
MANWGECGEWGCGLNSEHARPQSQTRRLTVPVALALGFMLLGAAWIVRASPARAQTPPTCAVGTSACQQALLWVDKGSGAAVAKVLIPGDNTETNHNDALECHGPAAGKCYLAFGSSGLGVLETAQANSCNPTPSANVAKLGGTGSRFDAIALANGTLYGIVGTQFGKVDTSNGAFTPIGTMGSASGMTVGGTNSLVLAMAWDATAGNFLVSVDQAHGGAASKLVRIDLSTGHVVTGAFGGSDLQTVSADAGRSQASGIVFVGSTLYAAVSAGDTGGHLETLNASMGALTDIGVFGAEIPKVRSLTADASGQLYGLTGSAGGFVSPIPCPSSPTPSPSTPTPTPSSPTPTPSVTSPGGTPTPSPSVSVGATTFTRTPTPGTSVLGASQTRRSALPVTGSNALPLVLFAGMCYVFGAVALKVASKRRGVALDSKEDASE